MLRLASVAPLALVFLLIAPLAQAQEQAPPPDPFASADELAPPAPAGEAEEAPANQPTQPEAAQPAPAQGQPVQVYVQAPAGYQASPGPTYQPQQAAPRYATLAGPPLTLRAPGAIWGEIGGGLLGMGVGIGATYAMIANSHSFDDAVAAIVFAPIISFWATDLGIFFGGRLTNGQASFGWTLLGTAIGTGVGTLIGFRGIVWNNDSKAAIWAATGISFACAIAGGVTFFEWGDSRTRRRAAGRYAFVPYLAPTRGGATFGLGATF